MSVSRLNAASAAWIIPAGTKMEPSQRLLANSTLTINLFIEMVPSTADELSDVMHCQPVLEIQFLPSVQHIKPFVFATRKVHLWLLVIRQQIVHWHCLTDYRNKPLYLSDYSETLSKCELGGRDIVTWPTNIHFQVPNSMFLNGITSCYRLPH